MKINIIFFLLLLSFSIQAQSIKVIFYISDKCPDCAANLAKLKASGIEPQIKKVITTEDMLELKNNTGGNGMPAIYFQEKIGTNTNAASYSGYNCSDLFLKSEYAAKLTGSPVEETSQTEVTPKEVEKPEPVLTLNFTKEEIAKANTAKNANYLSDEEKKMIQLMNLARIDGKRFYDYYVKEYIKLYNAKYPPIDESTNAAMISLKSDLYAVKNKPLLYPDDKLSKAAAFHAVDMGNTGNIGHNSSDGTDPFERIKRFASKRNQNAENCSYGFDTGLGVVGQLLHDADTPDAGHRKNILHALYTKVGVAIRSHKVYSFNAVQDFSN